jgi:hypothetical protein
MMGSGSFLIDAPLEKIKGTSDEVRGYVDVNPKDLAKRRDRSASGSRRFERARSTTPTRTPRRRSTRATGWRSATIRRPRHA